MEKLISVYNATIDKWECLPDNEPDSLELCRKTISRLLIEKEMLQDQIRSLNDRLLNLYIAENKY